MKDFKDLAEVLNDEICKKFIEEGIETAKIEHGKEKAKELKTFGWCKLSGSPYSSLLLENKLNYSSLKVEYLQIVGEISFRTALDQYFITNLVEDAILKTIVYYEKQKEEVTV